MPKNTVLLYSMYSWFNWQFLRGGGGGEGGVTEKIYFCLGGHGKKINDWEGGSYVIF